MLELVQKRQIVFMQEVWFCLFPLKKRKVWHDNYFGNSQGNAVAIGSGAELLCQTQELRDAVMPVSCATAFTQS